jgi:hypothetical protein
MKTMRFNLKQTGLLLAGLGLLVAGCESPALKSKLISGGGENDKIKTNCCALHHPTDKKENCADKNDKPVKGIAYSLPMVKIHLTAILTNTLVLDPTNSYYQAFGVSNLYTTTVNYSQTNGGPVSTNVNTSVVFYSNNIVVTKWNTNKQAYMILVEPVVLPDPDALYVLKLTRDDWSSDVFGITVDPVNNFLQTINATNSDHRPSGANGGHGGTDCGRSGNHSAADDID